MRRGEARWRKEMKGRGRHGRDARRREVGGIVKQRGR